MSQIDNPENNSADARLGNILRDTLLKRTGRDFKRNLDTAFVPIQEKESHEDVAERIFDNIIRRKIEKHQPQEEPAAAAQPEQSAQNQSTQTESEPLDAILWPGNEAALNHQQQLDAILWPANEVQIGQIHEDFLDDVHWPGARTAAEFSQSHEQKLDAVLWPQAGTEAEPSQDQKLDAILWPEATGEAEPSQDQKLEAILWPNVSNFIDFV